MFKIKKQQAAGANCSAMEQRPFQKRVSPKNHKSRINFFILCTIIPILFVSCGTRGIYTKPDATSYAMKHRTIAVMTPKVKVMPTKYKTAAEREELEKTQPAIVQEEIVELFNKYASKGKIHIEIQDVKKTQRLLLEIDCPNGNCDMSPEQIARILGVDAILYSELTQKFDKETGMGVLCIIFGIAQPYFLPLMIIAAVQNFKVQDRMKLVNVKLYDGRTGDLLYTYNRGGGFTKKLVKKSPYYGIDNRGVSFENSISSQAQRETPQITSPQTPLQPRVSQQQKSDIITLKNGDEIQGIVQEVGTDVVKYKKADNQTGPNYTIKKSDIFMIKYANGSRDVFNNQ